MLSADIFKFRTNVSLDYYEKKTDAIACLSKEGASKIGKNKMAFTEMSVTVSEFLELATSGHAFCNLFDYDPNKKYWVDSSDGKKSQVYPVYKNGPNQGAMKLSTKSEQFFKGAQTVFVDVDYTRFTSVSDYIATLSYTPTCVYMSYSDGAPKGKEKTVSRRFRLVYVLDQIVGKDDLKRISQAINDQIVIDTAEPMDDDCGTRPCQYMNGVYGNPETYSSGIIYSVSDFPAQIDPVEPETPQQEPGKISFSETLVKDMKTMDYDNFMHIYSTRFPYLFRVEKEAWTGIGYQLTDESYLQTWFYREKQVDGQMRRRKLGKNACLRRIMFPWMDADTLLFNLYVDRERFFDNSDGVITIDTLLRKVRWAMEMSQEQLVAFCDWEIKYWQEHRPKFIMKDTAIKDSGTIARIAKTIRWAEIDAVYDRSKSINENLENIDVSLRTLYRYCKERWIDTQPGNGLTKEQKREERRRVKRSEIETVQRLYNPALSLRKNLEIMAAERVVMSTTRLKALIDKYYEPKQAMKHSDIFIPDLPSFSNWQPQFEVPVCDWDVAVAEEKGQLPNTPWGEAPQFKSFWC